MSRKKIEISKKSFGERLRSLRVEANLTIERVAKSTGIPKSTLSELENNKYNPSASTLVRLSEYFNVSSNELLTGGGVPGIAEPLAPYSVNDSGLIEQVRETLNAGSPYTEMLRSQIIATHSMMKTQKELDNLKKKAKKAG